MKIEKGQVWYADLNPAVGSEQGGVRPVLIVQNDKGNKHSPTTIIAIITTRPNKAKLPTHCWISKACGLPHNSMVELEQIRTIDKSRLTNCIGKITAFESGQVDCALCVSLGILK